MARNDPPRIGSKTRNFAAAAGLTNFLPASPCSFLNTTRPISDIRATKMKAAGASTGGPIDMFIVGKPKVYESVTIRPKTAADQMFSSLSETSLWNKKSVPTATPTAIRAQITTVKPRFHPVAPDIIFVTVTCDHRAAETAVIMARATKVSCIIRFFDIGPHMCGAEFTTSSLEDSLLIIETFSNEDLYLSSGLLNSFGI